MFISHGLTNVSEKLKRSGLTEQLIQTQDKRAVTLLCIKHKVL